jgi:hypothetical protein
MEINVDDVVQERFLVNELLKPLDKKEQTQLKGLLRKLRKYPDRDNSTLSVWFVDMLHENHTEELSSIICMMLNKLVQEPFAHDRNILKSTLEAIMQGVFLVEEKEK